MAKNWRTAVDSSSRSRLARSPTANKVPRGIETLTIVPASRFTACELHRATNVFPRREKEPSKR